MAVVLAPLAGAGMRHYVRLLGVFVVFLVALFVVLVLGLGLTRVQLEELVELSRPANSSATTAFPIDGPLVFRPP